MEKDAKEYPNPQRPAYPTNNRMYSAAQGLTKREYFAAMAMQGILAGRNDEGANLPDSVASWAIEQADELLKQLEI